MSSTGSKKTGFFQEFSWELKMIFSDILFMYRNFFHWNISKILIFIWSMILWVLLMIPIFVIALIVWVIDPINWMSIVSFGLGWEDASLEILASYTEHFYWALVMLVLWICGLFLFLLGTSYSFLLMARLSLKYTQRKKLSFKKNLYFSRKHIKNFFMMSTLFLLPFLILLILGIFVIALVSQIFPLEITAILTILVWIGIAIYIAYRTIFSFIILAEQKKSAEIHKSKSYRKSSFMLTTGKNIWKFLFLFFLYLLLKSPFNSYEIHLEKQMQYMGEAFAYQTGQIQNVSESKQKYLELLSQEYSDLSSEELQEKIIGISRIRILYAVLLFFVFGGLGVMLLTSFYTRVLLKK